MSEDQMRSEYRELSAVEKRQVEEVKVLARHLYGYLKGLGAGREQALALTRLEESVMWAVKHITGKVLVLMLVALGCGVPPLPPIPPIGTSSCEPVCQCDSRGQECRWVFQCE